MSTTKFFQSLDAPLANSRWSWGSVRAKDGSVFLRVWQDQKATINGIECIRLTDHQSFVGNEQSLGYRERLNHVEAARQGNPCFLVLCSAVDTTAAPRKIAHLNQHHIIRGGRIVEHEGDSWIELQEQVPVSAISVGDV